MDKDKFNQELNNFFKEALDTSSIQRSFINSVKDRISKSDKSLDVKQLSNTALDVSYQILTNSAANNGVTFIDMKEIFARSPKAKRKKDGGWYLVVPIQDGTTQLRSAYGRSVWDQISHTEFGTTSSFSDIERVQSKLGYNPSDSIDELQYKWKSANITRFQKCSSGKRASYISFRTVSDKSDPNSWIVGRKAVSQNSNTQVIAPYLAKILKERITRITDEMEV